MPLRKAKGRRKPPKAASAGPVKRSARDTGTEENQEEEEEEKSQEQAVVSRHVEDKAEEETRPESQEAFMDEEERRARETIALLAKKYQVRVSHESSTSLDIIRVDDSEASKYGAGSSGEKENMRQPLDSPRSSRRAKLIHKTAVREKKKAAATPVFKVPKPLVNHSTPAPTEDRNLFGFEELDSPLTLSPVASTPIPAHLATTLQSPETRRRVIKPSPYSRLKGTYDIPLKKKTPKRPPGQKREKRKSVGAEDRWAENLNTQFSEVEQFELAVE